MKISIIIPVYNEQCNIPATLNFLENCGCEIIIVDGHPEDTTIKTIKNSTAALIHSGKGRGVQMNTGAKIASGDIFLFLHADTILPSDFLSLIDNTFLDKSVFAGAFDLGIDSPELKFRIIEKISSIRSRITKIPYGDQCIFIKKCEFERVGGFKNIPIMEDADLMMRLKKSGRKIKIIDKKVKTSPRRWKKEGTFYTTIRNWSIMTLFLLGIPAQKLARWYAPHKK